MPPCIAAGACASCGQDLSSLAPACPTVEQLSALSLAVRGASRPVRRGVLHGCRAPARREYPRGYHAAVPGGEGGWARGAIPAPFVVVCAFTGRVTAV